MSMSTRQRVTRFRACERPSAPPRLRGEDLTAEAQRRRVRFARLVVLVGGMLLSGVIASNVRGQSLWEISPYQMRVWLTFRAHPRIPSEWQEELKRQLEQQAASLVGAGWNLVAEPTPPTLQADVLADRLPAWQTVVEADTTLRQADKLYLLSLDAAPAGYGLQVRELDLGTQTWGPPVTQVVNALNQVPAVAFDLLCDAFLPLARILRVDDETVTAVIRAGALLRPPSPRSWDLPTRIEAGQVLQPVIVRTDRNGLVPPGGARPIEWTLLLVKSRHDSTLECQSFSGYRQPFSARRSARVDELALVIKPRLSRHRVGTGGPQEYRPTAGGLRSLLAPARNRTLRVAGPD